MTLSDYILSYEENGKIVVNLFDYYERYIKPLSSKFRDQSYDNKLVLCWFKDHADINPSMGYIADRNHKGNKLYHCFGCGKTGDVVRLNQYIESIYHNNELTEHESAVDLAQKFGVDISEFNELEDEDYDARFIRNIKKTEILKRRYTVADFNASLLEQRKEGVDLERVNFECVKMIATVKQLYN